MDEDRLNPSEQAGILRQHGRIKGEHRGGQTIGKGDCSQTIEQASIAAQHPYDELILLNWCQTDTILNQGNTIRLEREQRSTATLLGNDRQTQGLTCAPRQIEFVAIGGEITSSKAPL